MPEAAALLSGTAAVPMHAAATAAAHLVGLERLEQHLAAGFNALAGQRVEGKRQGSKLRGWGRQLMGRA
jgi:hypothetical protein